MKATRTNPKTSIIRLANYWVRPTFAATCVAALIGLTAALNLHATVLDNFSGAKTGWTDTLNGGSVNQAGGQFTVSTAVAGGTVTSSQKTSTPLALSTGNALEVQANVASVSPGSGNPSTLSIVGWVPTGGQLLANGYSLVFGSQDFIIQRNGTALFTTNFSAVPLTHQNANVKLLLRITANSDGSATLLGRVYIQVANGQSSMFNVVFEQTVTDATGITGSGFAALGAKNQTSPTGATVAFSLAQYFITTSTLLDTFTGSSVDTTKWQIYAMGNAGDSVTESAAGLNVKAGLSVSGGFAGVFTKTAAFPIAAGGQVEFQVDMVDDSLSSGGGAGSYAVLGYLPNLNPAYLATLTEYHIAHDSVSESVIASGKGYNCWWGARNDIQPPVAPPGVRYVLTMSGETNFAGSVNCRIDSRIEDLKFAVNDPARLVYQSLAVDTTNFDAWSETGYLGPIPGPFVNVNGVMSIGTFNSGVLPYSEVLFKNAVVRKTVPPPSAPILTDLVPAFGANFVASASVVSFTAADNNGNNIPTTGMSITLNGVTYTSASPGVSFSGAPGTVVTMTLSGALAAQVNYVGSVQSINSLGLSSSLQVMFDTFSASDYTVESEDYNFSSDGVAGGVFIDNPGLFIDGWNDATAYNSRVGLPGIDFVDNRGTTSQWPDGIADANHTFRYDWPRNMHAADGPRPAYVTAGVPETEVNDIYNGDWMNYTHGNYPLGTYQVYLRQAASIIDNSLVTLERVTGATGSSQVNYVLGSFTERKGGISLFVNTPLNDGIGNPMVLRLTSASDTFQINNRITGNASETTGSLQQNYFVFVPVTISTNLGPVVVLTTPLANELINTATPAVTALIANRDTSVNVGSIVLKVNGSTVAATKYATNNGAYVTYTMPTPLPVPGSTVTTTLIYLDNASTSYTNTWTWTLTYPYFNPAYSQAVGSMTLPGFDARTVVSYATPPNPAYANMSFSGGIDDSVASAKTLLVQPQTTYTVNVTSTNIEQTVNWDIFNAGRTAYPSAAGFPGLCNPTAWPNSFAVETFAYLHLQPGINRFYVDSDDKVGIYTGSSLRGDLVVLLETTGVVHQTFDCVVGAEGLYPIHIVYAEGGGDGYLRLQTVDLAGNTTNLTTAFYPFVVQSATSPKGSWTADAAANAANVLTTAGVPCDGSGAAGTQTLTGGTITVPVPASPKFYRIDGPRPTKITSVKKVGSNLVIQYTGQ